MENLVSMLWRSIRFDAVMLTRLLCLCPLNMKLELDRCALLSVFVTVDVLVDAVQTSNDVSGETDKRDVLGHARKVQETSSPTATFPMAQDAGQGGRTQPR